jgi:hypothetical protein
VASRSRAVQRGGPGELQGQRTAVARGGRRWGLTAADGGGSRRPTAGPRGCGWWGLVEVDSGARDAVRRLRLVLGSGGWMGRWLAVATSQMRLNGKEEKNETETLESMLVSLYTCI